MTHARRFAGPTALLLVTLFAPRLALAAPGPGRWLGERLAGAVPGLGEEFFGSPLWAYLFALVTLVVVVLLRGALMGLTMRLLRQVTTRTRTELDDKLVDALDPPLGIFIGFLGLYLASLWLVLPTEVDDVISRLLRLVVIASVGMAAMRSTSLITEVLARLARRTETELDDHLVPLVGRIARVVIALMVVVFFIQELGFDVTGLLTGLGVGGLAFALAAKDTLANWFGALMIYTDRPFDVGDWVKTPDLEGTVEEIGLRSTRIRTFAKTVVTVPNQSLAVAVIENFSRMPTRRVYFNLGVTYATTPAMMRESVARIEDILRTHPDVDQSFWLVKFTDFAASSLDIMIYYFTTTTDWARYLQIRGDINLQIIDRLGDIGVQIAFPSRSIYLEGGDKGELAELDARAREAFASRVKVEDRHSVAVAPADGAP
ncbi:MAG: mechanosensitive ion channel family protein [Nannocystaceae bacterium]